MPEPIFRVQKFSPHPYVLNTYTRETVYEGDSHRRAMLGIRWGRRLRWLLGSDVYYVLHTTNFQELGWPEGYDGEGEDDYDEWAPEPRWRPSPAYYEALNEEPETRGYVARDEFYGMPENLLEPQDFNEDGDIRVGPAYLWEDPRIGRKEDAR